MDTIFTLGDMEDDNIKLNLDDLYEKKKKQDLNTLSVYNKIINRIHARIKTISRQQTTDQYCWYVIPEMIIGVPKYDQAGCIAYIMDTLQTNGFQVRYFHPNTIFISWNHWVPSYVRTEIKKKTGIVVNEYGEKIKDEKAIDSDENEDNVNESLQSQGQQGQQGLQQIKNSKKYTPINSYKPSGKLVYSEDLLNKIENKFS